MPASPPVLQRALAVLWGDEPKMRIRLQQWTVTLGMYAASAAALGLGVHFGYATRAAVAVWIGLVLVGMTVFYALMRSGASRRFADPALTAWQIGFGITAVVWAYANGADVRSAALFALMPVLTFGAFSLDWRRLALLTAAALGALALAIAWLHDAHPGRYDPRVDRSNLLIAAVMLPASSVVAGLLGSLRSRLHRQRAELTAALARIQELATRDDLTGLPNRRHMQERLAAEHERCHRTGAAFTLALIDLDHFKRINDARGHAGGDLVLRAFADEAVTALRASDVLARWGGEEFLVLLPDTSPASAAPALERLRLRIAGSPAGCTVSCGVAGHRRGENVADTLARADAALYAAKAGGRDRVVVDGLDAPAVGAPRSAARWS